MQRWLSARVLKPSVQLPPGSKRLGQSPHPLICLPACYRMVFHLLILRTSLQFRSCELLGTADVWLDTAVCAAPLAILWLATRGEGLSPPAAETLDCAAGLSGKQKWGLILPSSVRVSRVTYQTVIGVCYPELVKPTRNMGDMCPLKQPHKEAFFSNACS